MGVTLVVVTQGIIRPDDIMVNRVAECGATLVKTNRAQSLQLHRWWAWKAVNITISSRLLQHGIASAHRSSGRLAGGGLRSKEQSKKQKY